MSETQPLRLRHWQINGADVVEIKMARPITDEDEDAERLTRAIAAFVHALEAPANLPEGRG